MHGNIGNTRSSTAGRFRAGPNLYRQIAESGAGSWVLRYEMAGRKRWMGLGPLAVFSLREAMQRARSAQQLIYSGVDPIDQRRQARASEARKAILTITFEAATQAFFDQHQTKWGHKARTEFLNTLASYAYPVFGQTAVADIDTALVLRAIEPIWLTKHSTANRVRGRIESVLDWAKVRGYRPAGSDNPAAWTSHLDQLLPVGGAIGKVKHHPAMAYADVPSFVETLKRQQGIEPRALELLILSASRTSEVLLARWSEVDFATQIWTRPASHMKAGIEHQVPLTPRMIEILESLPKRPGLLGATSVSGHQDSLIFESSKAGRPLGRNALAKLADTMGADFTIHGFRSSFRDWAGEQTSYAREVIEHALAHAVGNAVEQAYSRSKLLQKRRRLMTEWEGFVATAMATTVPSISAGSVVPIRKGAG
jgi:integrase